MCSAFHHHRSSGQSYISDRLTTNRLARKAGFSIGTIYQYFPNREAIVLALIERQREEVRRRVEAVLASDQAGTADEKIRRIVRVLHESFSVHRMPERRFAQALIRLIVGFLHASRT